MIRAWTDGSTAQARTPDGALLYWEQDVSDATLGTNGYPFIDGVQVPTTTTESPYPVMVYVYREGDRWKQTFAEEGNYGPRQIWGEGDGTSSGNGRGYIEKLGESFDIYNKGTDGVNTRLANLWLTTPLKKSAVWPNISYMYPNENGLVVQYSYGDSVWSYKETKELNVDDRRSCRSPYAVLASPPISLDKTRQA